MSVDEAGLGSTGTLDDTDDAGVTIHWWREIAYIVGFYAIYTLVRNQFGSAAVGVEHAYTNAVRIIDVEKALGLFHEATIQGWFLGMPWFLRLINVFYGSFHFVVTAAVLVWLAARHPRAYPTWRNTILFATGLALLGFSLFPLMPPRLLCDCPYGAGPQAAADGLPTFVDTLAVHGGLWSFDDSTMAAVSNQYAAMPSLHIGWALLIAYVVIRTGPRPFAGLAVLHAAATVFVVVITANHWWLDGVIAAALLALALMVFPRPRTSPRHLSLV